MTVVKCVAVTWDEECALCRPLSLPCPDVCACDDDLCGVWTCAAKEHIVDHSKGWRGRTRRGWCCPCRPYCLCHRRAGSDPCTGCMSAHADDVAMRISLIWCRSCEDSSLAMSTSVADRCPRCYCLGKNHGLRADGLYIVWPQIEHSWD